MSEYPRKGYQMRPVPGGRWAVVERELIERNGSWLTTKTNSGEIVKENGVGGWHETAFEAIQDHVIGVMHAHLYCTPNPGTSTRTESVFDHDWCVEMIQNAVEEAARWGNLAGLLGIDIDSVPED